jgi:outer membrane protein W
MRWHSFVAGVALVGATVSQGSAQAFKAGSNYLGPSISLAAYGSTAAFAGNFEHAINDKWGWGVSAGYFSYGYDYGCFDFNGICSGTYTYIPIAVTANYHFPVSGNDKLDPFVSGGLGYFVVSCSDCGAGARASTLYPVISGGLRYWVSEKIALTGRAGYGLGFISVGVDFKM